MPGGGTNVVYDDETGLELPSGTVTSDGGGFDWGQALFGLLGNAAAGYIYKETGYQNTPQAGYVMGPDGRPYIAGQPTGPGMMQVGGASIGTGTLLLVGVGVLALVLLVRD